mmetsp:Transcript_67318/g.186541  ORF Transcript_67318/g.186541 Transcript_67318/m.186541 type:complete len:318 (+) Transcript_67318:384-1337(+)
MVHVNVAVEVVRLSEGSEEPFLVCVLLHVSQVDEVHILGELLAHCRDVVVRARAVRAHAKRESVVLARLHGQESPDVGGGGHHARQAEEPDRRIVGVDAHVHSHLPGHRHHGLQEDLQVPLHVLLSEAPVVVQGLLEQFHGVDSVAHAAGQALDDVVGEGLALLLAHLLKCGLCLSQLLLTIVLLRARPLQNVQVECRKLAAVEPQGHAPVGGPPEVQVRPRPVHHGHEVVAQDVDAHRCHVADALLVVLDVLVPVGASVLDLLVHGNALDHGPSQPRCLDGLLALLQCLSAPNFTSGNVVQGRDNAGGTHLLDVLQ